MDDDELAKLLSDIESDRSERTESLAKIDKFGSYRNPVLAEAARNLGYVNRFGRGVPRTQAAMKRNGSPAPQFLPGERHFLVVLRRRP